jgi:hypothetical protein
MRGVKRAVVTKRLQEWGFWLRTAKSPRQSHTLSQLDSPLQCRKRRVLPVFRCENAETLDLIMSFHLDRDVIAVLETYYSEQLTAQAAASVFGCCIRTYTARRKEAESILWGILLATPCKS